MNTNAPPKQREEMPPGLEIVIVTRVREIVDGFKVRRVLPYVKRRMVGPFIFLDQMGLEVLRAGRGLDVAPHPHIGLATVTYLFEGELMHRDSLRGGGRLRALGAGDRGERLPPRRQACDRADDAAPGDRLARR